MGNDNIIAEGTKHIKDNKYDASYGGKDNFAGDLIIPEGVIRIGSMAFFNNAIVTLYLPNSLKYIGQEAFIGNPLRKITIGADVELIENYGIIKEGPIPNSFKKVYESNGQKKGVYELKNKKWIYVSDYDESESERTEQYSASSENKFKQSKEEKQCFVCKNEVPFDAKYCHHCGESIHDKQYEQCPACKKTIPISSKFCPYCRENIFRKLNNTSEKNNIIAVESADMNLKNAFIELELKFNSNLDECKKARDALLLKYHPDKNTDATDHVRALLQEKTKKINEAFDYIKKWYKT